MVAELEWGREEEKEKVHCILFLSNIIFRYYINFTEGEGPIHLLILIMWIILPQISSRTSLLFYTIFFLKNSVHLILWEMRFQI